MNGAKSSDTSRDPWLLPAFLGVARLPINNLNFEHELFKQHRPVSEKVVDRLRTVFRREGCLRSQSQNWIDALVDPRRLRSALTRNGLTQNDICPEAEELPLLELGPVDCLQGIHRILAATDVLNQNDRWWTVRLYCPETLPETTSLKIIEGSLNEQPHSDGEIFRKIRIYHKEGNKQGENKWWARLTPTKQKDLKQLLKNPQFAKAFDDLVDMPGLWHSIKLGTLHRLLTLRCDEEILRYLRHVLRTWKSLLSNAGIAPEAVDRDTVERLELLAPSASETDRILIGNYMSSREVFQTVTHESARQSIHDALTSLPGLIPSLRSFFENLKYLEPCSNILRKLLGPKEKKTIYQSLAGSYFAPSEHVVEYSERRRRVARTGRGDETGLWLSYVQLWAFCLRHFPSMTELVPRKELKKDKPSIRSNAALWHYLGDLAINLGFRTEQAEIFKKQDPYRCLAEQFLTSQADSIPDSRVVKRMAIVLKQADKGPAVAKTPQLTDEQCLSRDRRCGRPFDDDFTSDKDSLFLPLIYESESREGIDISPFFVKKDMFLSFLGNKYTKSSDDPIIHDDSDGDDPNGDIVMVDEAVSSSGPSELRGLKAELESVKQQNGQLGMQLETAHREKRALERDRDNSRAREQELESRRREIDDQLNAKAQELLEEQRRNQNISGQIDTLRQEMGVLERQRDDILASAASELSHGERVTQLEQLISQANGQIRDLTENLNASHDQVRVLSEDLEVSRRDNKSLHQAAQAKFDELQNIILERTKELEQSQTEQQNALQQFNLRMEQASTQYLALQHELESYKNRLSLANTDIVMGGEISEIDQLRQKLAHAEHALSQLQLQLSTSENLKEQEMLLADENSELRLQLRKTEFQLQTRQSQAAIFGMLQASLENFSTSNEKLGKFDIITPTAVISIDIPKPGLASSSFGTLGDSPIASAAGLLEERANPSSTDACIDRVLTTIKEFSKSEPWAIYIKLQKVLPSHWEPHYIRTAMEEHGTCIVGPEALLSSIKARTYPGSSWGPVDDRSEQVISDLEAMSHWIESVKQDEKRRKVQPQVEEVESEGSEHAEQSHSMRQMEGRRMAMIEGGSPSGDSENISQERLALVRRNLNTPSSLTL